MIFFSVLIPALLIVATFLFGCTCIIACSAWLAIQTPLGTCVDFCIDFLRNLNKHENVETKTNMQPNNCIVNENYVDMSFAIPPVTESKPANIEQSIQETCFNENQSSAMHAVEMHTTEDLSDFSESRSSTPHAWQENSCHSVNIVQAQVHASDESPGLSPVRYLEGHVQYLSRSTMQINHMLYNDAIIILNDKIEYD